MSMCRCLWHHRDRNCSTASQHVTIARSLLLLSKLFQLSHQLLIILSPEVDILSQCFCDVVDICVQVSQIIHEICCIVHVRVRHDVLQPLVRPCHSLHNVLVVGGLL